MTENFHIIHSVVQCEALLQFNVLFFLIVIEKYSTYFAPSPLAADLRTDGAKRIRIANRRSR